MPEILKLWILHNPSGICIFEQTFEDLDGDADPFVVTGFLYAIANITRNITMQKIEFVQMNRLRFSYFIHSNYMLIIVSPKETQLGRITQIMNQIQKKFEMNYLDTLTPIFTGNITKFKEFAKDIESIVQLETKYYQYLDKRNEKLKDLFQAQTNEWLSLKRNLKAKSTEFGTWIIKAETKIDKNLYQNISESRNIAKTNNKKEDLESNIKEKKNKNKWV